MLGGQAWPGSCLTPQHAGEEQQGRVNLEVGYLLLFFWWLLSFFPIEHLFRWERRGAEVGWGRGWLGWGEGSPERDWGSPGLQWLWAGEV